MVNNQPKRLLVISEVFAPEEFLINDIAFFWKEQGHSVTVLTRNPSYPNGGIYPGYKNRLFQKESFEGIEVNRVQFIPGYKKNNSIKIFNYLWNTLLGIIWALKNGNRFDSIYIYQTGPLTFSSVGIIIKKLHKTKVTIWTQDVWPDTVYAYGFGRSKLGKFILEKFVKWIYSNTDNITVSCPGFESIIKKYCPSKPIHFIPQWSSTPSYKPNSLGIKENILPGTFNFVFAGNVGKVQNLENAILGFEKFISEKANQQAWFNIIGDGSHLYALKAIVAQRKIGNIKFWGRVASKEIPGFYNNADVLVISLDNKPIFNLTIPAKFQSYLNAEKPIFGIIGGEVTSLINQYDLGWTADPDNIDDISRVFQLIADADNESFQKKTRNAQILLNESFNREKLIKRITEFVS